MESKENIDPLLENPESLEDQHEALKQRYQSLLASSSRMREHLLLLDVINTHIFHLTDPTTYGAVNKAHADFFGVNKRDLEQKNLYDILTTQEADICAEANRKLFLNKKQIVTEEVLVRADGKERAFTFTKTPKLDENGNIKYVVCTGEDITDLIQSRQEIKDHQLFLENVIESIQDGMSVLDKDFTILHTNSVIRKWYKDSGTLVGQKCYKAYHHSDSRCSLCPTARALKSGLTESEIVRGLHGSQIDWVEIYSFPIKNESSGEISGVVEFVRDISEKIRLEEQLSQAQKMEAVGTLSAGIAHDFNNIMQAILGSIQLLLINKTEYHEDYKYLSLIEKSVDRAKELTTRMLFLGRKIDSNLQMVNLNNEMTSLIKILERSIPKMITIQQTPGRNLKNIKIDITQMQQVMLNLAINASHAMPDGGKLLLSTENAIIDHVHLKTNKDFHIGEYVVLTVSDTGTGMNKETLSHIFEPFFTTKDTDQGTGLGLAMVYGIVKNHNGVITCYSEPEIGTTFRLFFPACDDQEQNEKNHIQENLLSKGSETIMVVDDEELLLDLGCEILEQFGYRTIRASSGEEALSLLKRKQTEIDLVLLDLNMPGMGGHKCLKKINMMDNPPKVIIATGYAAKETTRKMVNSGASGFLAKPYQVKKLIASVQLVLNKK